MSWHKRTNDDDGGGGGGGDDDNGDGKEERQKGMQNEMASWHRYPPHSRRQSNLKLPILKIRKSCIHFSSVPLKVCRNSYTWMFSGIFKWIWRRKGKRRNNAKRNVMTTCIIFNSNVQAEEVCQIKRIETTQLVIILLWKCSCRTSTSQLFHFARQIFNNIKRCRVNDDELWACNSSARAYTNIEAVWVIYGSLMERVSYFIFFFFFISWYLLAKNS